MNISANGIASKEAGKALAEVLKTNTVLKELDVSDNMQKDMHGRVNGGDGPGFAKELAAGVSANGALTSLNVSEDALCGIDELMRGTYDASGLTALAEAIGKHQ